MNLSGENPVYIPCFSSENAVDIHKVMPSIVYTVINKLSPTTLFCLCQD